MAKNLQKNEIIEAQKKYERILKEQVELDEKIARKIERRLWLEEEAAKRATEEADERLAKRLMRKEKTKHMKKRLEKEMQQVERLSAQLNVDYRSETDLEVNSEPSPKPTYQRIMTEDEQEIDLSEFCMPPPPGLTPEELKLFLEDQDAEIARLLQRQELKRSRNPEKEKLALIEAQDFEIAKMLQKIEKERFKRIKEKMKIQRNQSSELSYQRTSTPLNSLNSTDQNKPENDYDIPENYLVNEKDETYEEPYQIINELTNNNKQKFTQSFHNIAMDLDPTYKRRSQYQSSSHGNLLESCVDDDGQPKESKLTSKLRDSLERLHPFANTNNNQRPFSTSSSSSNNSAESKTLNAKPILVEQNQADQAPPLPPRDVSLLYSKIDQQRLSNAKNLFGTANQQNLLPPHHPQHPNRRLSNEPMISSTNITSTQAIPIQGQRRIYSTEQTTKKSKKNVEGCKTQ